MNIVYYHQPNGKLGGITVMRRVSQGRNRRTGWINVNRSVASIDREMLSRGFSRGKAVKAVKHEL